MRKAMQSIWRLSSLSEKGKGWAFAGRNFRTKQSGSLLSEAADPDEPFGSEKFQYAPQMSITGGKQRCGLSGGQLVRRQVTSVLVEERQRTVVDDEVVDEKVFGTAKPFCK